MTLNKTCSQPAVQLCIHGPVFGVSCFIWMAYLSLGVMACPPWPPPVFCYWGRRAAEAAARPSEFRNVGCKMCVSGGTAGEGSESVWSLESLGVLFFTHTHTHTHTHTRLTIHTFPPICCCCVPTPTPLGTEHVWHNAYGNRRARLPMPPPRKQTAFTALENRSAQIAFLLIS